MYLGRGSGCPASVVSRGRVHCPYDLPTSGLFPVCSPLPPGHFFERIVG